MTATTDRVEAVSLVDRVLTLTRDRILSGAYPPGTRLRLQTLAEESGASLIPVREALRVLEAERLVETIPNRGARVSSLSQDDMEDLYSVRIILETQALRESPPMTEEEAEMFRSLLDRLKVAVEADDADLILDLHRQYHFGLYGRSHSNWLPLLIDLLWKHTERYQRLSLSFRHDGADHEHREVLEALAAGKTERAVQALRNHLSTTARLVGDGYREQLDEA